MDVSTKEKSDERQRKFWPLELALGLLPFSLLMQVVVWAIYLPFGLHAIADFRQMYTGGYMIRTGHATELYDINAQTRFQQQLFPQATRTSFLLINHPAFEELAFVPLSLFPYKSAFLIFIGVNCLALIASLKLLRQNTDPIRKRWRWAPTLLVLSFFPITRALLQGQDSIILLLFLSSATILLQRGRPLSAGIVIGLSVFRFQIALPILILYVLWKQSRLVLGFLISASAAVLLSVWTVGFVGMKDYLDLITSISVRMDNPAAIAHTAITPFEMMNLRGLISVLLWNNAGRQWIQITILLASVIVIFAASRMKPSLPLAIIVASLVSYHFIAHDATIWLIPIWFALRGPFFAQGLLAVAMAISTFSSLLPWNGNYGFIASIPLVCFFFAAAITEGRHRSRVVGPVLQHPLANP